MITHVAIKHKGTVVSLPKPNRHHDVIRLIGERIEAGDDCQGFLDEHGKFYRRAPALIEAQRCNQLLPRATHPGGRLYSEDVW